MRSCNAFCDGGHRARGRQALTYTTLLGQSTRLTPFVLKQPIHPSRYLIQVGLPLAFFGDPRREITCLRF